MKKLLPLLLCLLFSSSAFSQLYLNELMASNDTTIADTSGKFEDWIEIYNAGTDTVDLAGYFISDDLGDPTKFPILSGSNMTKITPGGFLLIWADDDSIEGPLHTNFKLKSGGESVGLFKPDTSIIDTITYVGLNADESYGRAVDGTGAWRIFNGNTTGDKPTPRSSNSPTTGLARTFASAGIQMYPNPANNRLFFSKSISFSIFDIQGKEIKNYMTKSEVDISNFRNGLYIILTEDGLSAKLEIYR